MSFDLFCHIDVVVAIEEIFFLSITSFCYIHTRARVKSIHIYIYIFHLQDG
jgi:hypothetical protein